MRIALFHNAPSGGAKRAIYEWMARLQPDHKIDVYSLSTANHEFCDVRPFARRHHIVEFTPRRLFEHPLGRLNQLQRWRDLGELLRIGQRFAETIDRERYDVVFAHTCMFTVIPTLLKYLETPSVYYLHEPFGPDFQRGFHRPYMQTQKLRNTLDEIDPFIKLFLRRRYAIQRDGVDHTTRLLANSTFTQAWMQRTYRVETPICHYGVNHEDFRPYANIQRDNYVISVGELSPRKGFDFLVDSLGYIPFRERPKLKLVCNRVDPDERAYIESLADSRGVELTIITNLNAHQLAIEYSRALLCVYAPVMEPFGLAPLEAMSCGLPVVGVNEGGVSESVVHGKTGLLVERDPAKFAQAVRYLLNDPEQLASYAQNCRNYVLRNWSWEQSVACIEEHLHECANHKKDGAKQ
jgi:glycosyltransferase involved in cell wall biosynthesis